jgi:hypothetical protein
MPISSRRSHAAVVGMLALVLAWLPAVSSAGTVHTPHWIETHCQLWVFSNVLTGYPDMSRDGLSVQGKKIAAKTPANPLTYDIFRFTWHVAKQDQLCGVIGVWYQGDKTLRPTTETTSGGTYVDYTQNKEASGEQMDGIFVFAKRRG